MTFKKRVSALIEECFAHLHPCLYGTLGGASDLVAIRTALEREIAYLMPSADARGIVEAFIERLPEVSRVLATDVKAAYEGDPAATSPMEVVMAYPGL